LLRPGACARIPPTWGGGAIIIPDNPNWRRFRYACPYYRERWAVDDEVGVDGKPLLYQIICLQNTPPVDQEEQARCMSTRTVCWRLKARRGSRAPAATTTSDG
jgi:hypothetical protein